MIDTDQSRRALNARSFAQGIDRLKWFASSHQWLEEHSNELKSISRHIEAKADFKMFMSRTQRPVFVLSGSRKPPKAIRELLSLQPALHQAGLSRRICQDLDWRNASGQLKEMSCRVALLRMQKDGLLQLPKPLTKMATARRVRCSRPPRRREKRCWRRFGLWSP